jgi:hypothetical protein
VKLIAVGVGSPDKARILAERVFFFPFHNVSKAAIFNLQF